MAPSRRHVLRLAAGLPLSLGALSLVGCGKGPPDPVTRRAVGEQAFLRGARWLWKQQKRDGSFRSEVYGLMASGQSMTPFVLSCATDLPTDDFEFPRRKALAALEFIRTVTARSGAVGLSADVPDYPVYATSLSILAFARIRPRAFVDTTAPMVAWLRRQQLSAKNGWEGHPAHGGFPMGGHEPPSPPHLPHVDLSMTRAAVTALAALKVHDGDPAMVAARGFVERCRRPDGGYVYSPVHAALNKGQGDAGYGSATTDALSILVANRLPDEALQPHAEVLRAMHRVDRNPGIGEGPRAQYADAMRYYYRAGSARVFAWTGGPEGWADALVDALVEEQASDGSWRNDAPAQREDDPLVATALAVSALGWALRSWPRSARPRI